MRFWVLAWAILLTGGAPRASEPVDVQLVSPLTTRVVCPGAIPAEGLDLTATITVPANAPADLGIGAFIADRHGAWFQRVRPGPLAPGVQVVDFELSPRVALMAEPADAAWTAETYARCVTAGCFFWSAQPSRARLGMSGIRLRRLAAPGATQVGRLLLDRLDGMEAGADVATATTGERWTLAVRPAPFPDNPDDPDQFRLDALITQPDGRSLRIPAFSDQTMTLVDRGDRETARSTGPMRMIVRFRPRQPGRHRVRLEAAWQGGASVTSDLPDLQVAGVPWDGYARVDAGDPRFFAVDGRFWWPNGLNLHSTYDRRSQERLGTRLTPERGSRTTIALIQRLAAAGGNATEIWMTSWNAGLEWRAEWPGFAGVGRFNQANAARLDAILDAAWAAGVRVNLVIANHGQAAARMDSEWRNNPWNRANGGPLAQPLELFTNPVALAGQERLRRYLVGRYADHPAILGWKLWSEINLTAAGEGDAAAHAALCAWHERAAARWRALDNYGHPVTTHWAGDYRQSDWDIAALPGIGYLCIDAYHGGMRRSSGTGNLLAETLFASRYDESDGLGRFHKPLLVTECGGSAMGGTEAQLAADQASAGWAALVCGHGGTPMFWWFEWVDQGGHWQPYGALARFLAGEDPRGADAHTSILATTGGGWTLWGRAWTRRGRMLGYLLDPAWAGGGSPTTPTLRGVQVVIGSDVAAGTCDIEWWDADTGSLLERATIEHPGGRLVLSAPDFTRHLAFKLWRADEE
jgi:hypothetical protein